MKDKKHKKKILRPLALPFLEQLQTDLLQYFLRLSECAQAFFYLFLHGDGDLTHLPIAGTGDCKPKITNHTENVLA